jgi:hypothetical protein
MLIFDKNKHAYHYGGIKVPSVTQVLSQLTNFDSIPFEVLEHARKRGTAVHYGCELIDNDNIDWAGVHPEIEPYLLSWVKFKKDNNFNPVENEKRVYNQKYGFAGTLDVIGIVNNEKWLIDRKATATISPITALQTAAYNSCLDSDHRRFCIQLKKTGDYELVEYKNKGDFTEFLVMLNAYKIKEKYNGTDKR